MCMCPPPHAPPPPPLRPGVWVTRLKDLRRQRRQRTFPLESQCPNGAVGEGAGLSPCAWGGGIRMAVHRQRRGGAPPPPPGPPPQTKVTIVGQNQFLQMGNMSGHFWYTHFCPPPPPPAPLPHFQYFPRAGGGGGHFVTVPLGGTPLPRTRTCACSDLFARSYLKDPLCSAPSPAQTKASKSLVHQQGPLRVLTARCGVSPARTTYAHTKRC